MASTLMRTRLWAEACRRTRRAKWRGSRCSQLPPRMVSWRPSSRACWKQEGLPLLQPSRTHSQVCVRVCMCARARRSGRNQSQWYERRSSRAHTHTHTDKRACAHHSISAPHHADILILRGGGGRRGGRDTCLCKYDAIITSSPAEQRLEKREVHIVHECTQERGGGVGGG
ncbi:hypothetical protein GH5_08061 [Leishmania sp. Ghana 2012 LV757]|uniref:hypothetical protein n=1 Tax=Leishmania sp. Ghana 2012 LV757 TaxID=2803181 RepID=UPI001B75965D|nr:hypothetical protein GH5_08061 [Leishmania sp. Ghana 2012 LV757]